MVIEINYFNDEYNIQKEINEKRSLLNFITLITSIIIIVASNKFETSELKFEMYSYFIIFLLFCIMYFSIIPYAVNYNNVYNRISSLIGLMCWIFSFTFLFIFFTLIMAMIDYNTFKEFNFIISIIIHITILSMFLNFAPNKLKNHIKVILNSIIYRRKIKSKNKYEHQIYG